MLATRPAAAPASLLGALGILKLPAHLLDRVTQSAFRVRELQQLRLALLELLLRLCQECLLVPERLLLLLALGLRVLEHLLGVGEGLFRLVRLAHHQCHLALDQIAVALRFVARFRPVRAAGC